MEYGCIGERLTHSFSKEIHAMLGDYSYELCEVPRTGLDAFMSSANFRAINVTIPYKEAVIPYLYETDEAAKKIGAVNTVVNRDGKLYGYNTDFYGMTALLKRYEIDLSDKKALILGSGGTSKTARAVCESLGAREILTVSREKSDGVITYDEAYLSHGDSEIIINCTPVGMYPKCDGCPIDLSKFRCLEGVADAVYNPLETRIVKEAKKRGIKACTGLYMLVAQAARACEYFTDTEICDSKCEEIFKRVLFEKSNIILIGMPSSGKTTIGKRVAETLGRKFVDTDELVRVACGCEISEIFKNHGESYFRDRETEAVREAASLNGAVIATGGGVPLREENTLYLSQNGTVIFLDASLDSLCATSDRPLSSTRKSLEELYGVRYPIYLNACDTRIEVSRDVAENTALAVKEFERMIYEA